jgi:hypothetical protein
MELIELLQDEGIDAIEGGSHRHVRSGWIGIRDCPYCGSDGKYHLGINTRHGFASCWHCGPKSTVKVLMELLDRPYRECAAILSKSGLTAPPKKSVHTGRLQVPKRVDQMQTPHKDYLIKRGLVPEKMLELWNLQGIGSSAKCPWSIFIPIMYRGQVVSWTTRSIGDAPLRYIKAGEEEESIPASTLLYGEDYCRHGIVICEGPFDVYRIGPGAVAIMGLRYSKEQFDKMTRYPVRAVCFDSSPDAQARAENLANELSTFPGDTHNITLDSKDPGESSSKEIDFIKEVVEHGWNN